MITTAMEDEPDNWSDDWGEPEGIIINGDSAVATVEVDGEQIASDFVRERGRWWMVVFD